MANECIPVYEPGTQLSVTAGGAITGKTFVDISAALSATNGTLMTVVTATAAGKVMGVAAYDIASGARGRVIGEGIVPVTAGGNIAVGAEVEVGSNGKAVTISSGRAVARALTAGSADADVIVKLYRQ